MKDELTQFLIDSGTNMLILVGGVETDETKKKHSRKKTSRDKIGPATDILQFFAPQGMSLQSETSSDQTF